MGIPENTYKFIQKRLETALTELKSVEDEMSSTDPHSLTFTELKTQKFDIKKKITNFKLLLNYPKLKIEEQSEFCDMGNAVTLLLNEKEKLVYIDSIRIGKNVIISIDCQLAQEILGKKVGDKGFYICRNTGKVINWEIKKIDPHSIAKGILKPIKEDEVEEKTQEAETEKVA